MKDSEEPEKVVNLNSPANEVLLDAAFEGDITTVAKTLEQYPSEVNCLDSCGRTAIMLAAEQGYVPMVRLLLDHGADPTLTDESGDDALIKSSRTSENAGVIRLLLDNGVSVNRMYESDTTPLIQAASHGHAENVAVLLDYGADVNRVTSEEETALTFAIVNGTAPVVKLLIAAGADVNFEDSRGCTPLTSAIHEGDLEKVTILLQANADPHRDSSRPLKFAVQTGRLDIIAAVAMYYGPDGLRLAAKFARDLGLVPVESLLLDLAAEENEKGFPIT